jgi:coatomer subunit delta
LAASVVTKSGKALVSRQFVPMTRIRIEGLLAAFPKLVGGGGKQHTYVETENVRYVYQPLENGTMYLLLVTNKASNILEDLEVLRTLAKTLPEYCYQQVDEEGVSKAAFELIFAFDEVISAGHKENVTMSQIRTFMEMESHEEKLHKMIIQSKINDTKDVMKRKAMEIDKIKVEKKMERGGSSGGGFGGGGISGFQDKSDPFAGGMGGRQGSSGGFANDDGGFGGGASQNQGGFGGQSKGASDGYGEPRGPKGVAAKAGPKKGMVLGSKQKTNRFMDALRQEGESVEAEYGSKGEKQAQAAIPQVPTESVTIIVEEKLNVQLSKDGGLEGMEVQGTMMMEIQNEDDAFVKVKIESGKNEGYQFKTHPNIDKQLHANEGILGLKDPNRPFPCGSALGILKWRFQTKDESKVPITINCWPSVSGSDSFVSIEYEAADFMEYENVRIVIPIPSTREPPTVNSCDGDFHVDSRRNELVWSIDLIDDSNRNGSMEFVTPACDGELFFPVNVSFSARQTLCDVRIVGVSRTTDDTPVKYGGETKLTVEEYTVQ